MASTSIPDENLLNAYWNPTGFPSRIGAYHHDVRGDENFWNGLIDEVTLYNRALSASDSAWVYRGTCEPKVTVPDAFSFTPVTNAQPSTAYESNVITVTGITMASPISVSGGKYAVSTDGGTTWGEWTASAGTVNPSDTVKVMLVSTAAPSTPVSATLTIGGVSADFTATTTATPVASLLPTNGLVSLWRAEGNGLDSFGSNHGTLVNGTSFTSGKYGQAFSFDGVDDYVQIPNFITSATQFSFSFWMNITTFTNHNYMASFCQSSSIVNIFCFFAGDNSGGTFGFQGAWQDGSYFDLRKDIPFGTGVWKHIAVTYDGSTLRQYVDGMLDNHESYTGKTLGNNAPFIVGKGIAYPSGVPTTTYFNGLIDEFAIFNRALSTAEVSKLAGTYPDAFSFTAQTGVTLNTPIESNIITVTGITNPAAISITGGEYSFSTDSGVSWSPYSSTTPATVSVNNQIKVRLTSSSSLRTAATATLTIGGVSADFRVTTIGDTTPPVVNPSASTGNYTGSQTIVLSTEEGAIIYYTTDGSNPATNPNGTRQSFTGSGYIPITATTTLKYYAIDAAGNPSSVQTQVYTISYTLTVSRSGIGSGVITSNHAGIDCRGECSRNYTSGISVTLTATPDSGSIFTGWSGGGCPGTGTCTVTIDTDKTIKATFSTIAKGDLNNDGKVDLIDAIIAVQVMSKISPAQNYYKTADVNGDGRTGLPEAIYILQTTAELRAASPAGMVLIPAGTFQLGDAIDGMSDATPVHTVTLSAFYMDKYEVPKALWDEVYTWAADNGYSFDNAGAGSAANHPVHDVSWYDVVKWLNARSEMEGRTPVYYTDSGQATVYRTGQVNVTAGAVKWTANGYRLPTEAEWEYAARAGTTTRFYTGGNISTDQANYDVNNPDPGGCPSGQLSGGTTAVGSFAANLWGLYDMAGNVWELVWDWYGSYSYGQATNPKGPYSGENRVGRGGSFCSNVDNLRSAYRGHSSAGPSKQDFNVGFRSALNQL